ncbi:hypothetical protein [uncultured Tateyamaria sp.]|uniref:hypothetical protein n=1 Tax=uncultured Tateyamaria sp. TaxID=455651 RepID=UPI0026164F19|nr:hypothetical protein [uncultured Tateyamaria sp.]
MKYVLSALIVLSLLGVRTSAADEPRVVNGLTTLQSLGEIRLETVTVEGIEDAYSELEDLVVKLVEFLHPDSDAMRALSEFRAVAERKIDTWMLRCEASFAEQDCARVPNWDERLSSVLVQIEVYEFLRAEGAKTLEVVRQDKELAFFGSITWDRAAAFASLQNSLSAVQDLLERIEITRQEFGR